MPAERKSDEVRKARVESFRVRLRDCGMKRRSFLLKGKSVSCSQQAVELGAHIGGQGLWIGASAERLQKLLKGTPKGQCPEKDYRWLWGDGSSLCSSGAHL